jgi:integrase
MIAMLRAYGREAGEPIFQAPRLGKAFRKTPAAFAFAVKRLGLAPEDSNSLYAVTFHTLRHTFASWLAQSGKVSLIELKNLMRHANINMTMRYAHLIPGQESEKLSIIDGILA